MPHHVAHHNTLPEQQKGISWHKVGIAGALLGSAFLLRHLGMPARNLFADVPSDYKTFARVIASVLAVGELNSAMGWKPPAWLAATEALGTINLINHGLRPLTWLQSAIVAPVLLPAVQAISWLNHKIEQPAQESLGIPPTLTRLALSGSAILLGFAGLKGYLKHVAGPVLRQFENRNWLKKDTVEALIKNRESAGAIVACADGCGSVVCISEIGAVLGSWVKHKPGNTDQSALSRRTV